MSNVQNHGFFYEFLLLNENDSSFWNQLDPQDLRLKNPLSYQSQENMRRVSDRADKACNFLNLFALSILGSVYVSWVGINLDDNTFCRALWMACKAFLWQHTFEIGSNLKVGGLLGIFKKRFVLLNYYYDMYGNRMREWYATVYIIIGFSGLPPTLPLT